MPQPPGADAARCSSAFASLLPPPSSRPVLGPRLQVPKASKGYNRRSIVMAAEGGDADVQVVPSRLGGLGVIARRAFRKGEVVLLERPFLTVRVSSTCAACPVPFHTRMTPHFVPTPPGALAFQAPEMARPTGHDFRRQRSFSGNQAPGRLPVRSRQVSIPTPSMLFRFSLHC